MIREIFMKDLARFTYFNAKMTTDISTYKFAVLPGWMVQPLWLAITHGDPELKILHTARSRSKTEIFNQWKFTFKCTTCIIKLRARRLYNIPTITHINDIYNGDNKCFIFATYPCILFFQRRSLGFFFQLMVFRAVLWICLCSMFICNAA